MAIEHAHRICDWHENLPSDEIPPSWMWPHESELEIWFQAVEDKREENRPSGGSDKSVPMMQNELVAERKAASRGKGKGK